MFWRFGFTTSAIDKLLEEEDVKLGVILEEDDLLQEVKSHNQQLIEFLCRPEILDELLSYITATDLDETQRSKYPILAYEIVACEIQQIIDAIVLGNKELLPKFWSFLDHPITPTDNQGALTSVQVSCFCKVIEVLLMKKTVEMTDFIRADARNLSKILAHLQISAVMELLISLIRLEELPDGRGMVKWLSDGGLLENLVARLDPNLDSEEHSIAQQCICEIIRLSQTSSIDLPSIGINELILQLKSKPTMKRLVNYMLDPKAPNSTSSLINGVTIIIDLIRHNNSDIDGDPMINAAGTDPANDSTQPSSVSLADMLKVLADCVHDFNNLLTHPKSVSEPTRTTLGTQMALGFERLKICELFAELLHCSNMSNLNMPNDPSADTLVVDEPKETQDGAPPANSPDTASVAAPANPPDTTTKTPGSKESLSETLDKVELPLTTIPVGDQLKMKFIEHKVMSTCIALFFTFPWNSFLHYVIYDMLHQVLNGPMNAGYNRDLAIAIFKDGRLTDKIVEAQKKNDEECERPKGMRLGFMGHLTFIADEIVKLFEGYPEVIVEAIKNDVDLESWSYYCSHELKETKERDQLPLGGRPPDELDHEIRSDDEEELENLEDATARSQYAHYLAQRGGIDAEEEDDDDDDEDEDDDEQDGWMSGRNHDFGARFGMMRDGEDELEEEYGSDDEEEEEEEEETTTFPKDRTVKLAHGDNQEDEEDDPFGDFEGGDAEDEEDVQWKAFENMNIKETKKSTEDASDYTTQHANDTRQND